VTKSSLLYRNSNKKHQISLSYASKNLGARQYQTVTTVSTIFDQCFTQAVQVDILQTPVKCKNT